MDLIIPGKKGEALSDKETQKLKDGYNNIDKKLDFTKNKDWIHQAKKSFERLHELKDIWYYLTPDQKVKESHFKYDCIFRCKTSTKWISIVLFDEDGKIKEYTADHPFSARITMRIIMDDWPSFMEDFDEYSVMFHHFTNTIGISKKENQDVKVRSADNGEIKIEKITKDKYADFTFKNRDTGEIKTGLPFEIPEWFEKGEKKRLISDKEKRIKELSNKLNKMKKKALQDEANSYGVDTIKNVNGIPKDKTIKELINDIMEL